MTRIALLEDDEKVAKFITMGLKAESYYVENFILIDELIAALESRQFDILIMDRMIGKLDALDWMRAVRTLSPGIKIIILSALTGAINRITGLKAGADDYTEKPFQYHELSLRIKKLANKISQANESIIHYEDITLDMEGQKLQRSGITIHLSPYEYKLMTIFIKGPTKIHSRTELLDLVWGCNHDTGSNVVDVAIAKLRKKINFDNSIPLINSRRGSGYVLSGEDSQ